jgi:predicted O-methyltransferase YrrM
MPLVPVQVACLLFTLARVASPNRVVELGTGFGYSALLLALASAESHIVTIESNAECGKVAQSHFEKTGVSDRVSLLLGDAIPALQTMAGSFDFAFLDAAKEEYLSYLQLLLPRLRKGALLVADDVFFAGEMPGEHLSEPVKEKIIKDLQCFRRFLRQETYFLTSFLPMDCGVSVTLLTRHPEF